MMTGGDSRCPPRRFWRGFCSGAAKALALIGLFGSGCSDSSTPPTILDLTAPHAIGDLQAIDTTDSSVTIQWTAPSEDGDAGGAAVRYDIRYRHESLDVGVWSIADTVRDEPIPGLPGDTQTFVLTALDPDTLYAIGIVSFDDAGLASVLSNIAYGRTRALPVPPDTLPPAAVIDLAVSDVGPGSVRLSWTATGDDSLTGRATAYDARCRVGTLDDGTWPDAVPATGEPDPSPPGSSETFLVTGLSEQTDYAFALRVRDEAGNLSGLSNVVTARTPVRPPDFIDPRGIETFMAGDGEMRVFVADHGDDVLYRFTIGGERFPTSTVEGLCGVTLGAGAALYTFLIGGGEGEDSGTVWRFGGSSAQPVLLYDGLGFPSDIAVYPDGPFIGYLLVGERSRGRLLRLKPGSPLDVDLLATVTDGEVAGVAVDGAGTAYFGVRTAAGSVIRKIAGSGDPVLFHDLGAMGVVGDLRLDPRGNAIWYLDLSRSAAVRVNRNTAAVDTLASRLRRPLAIAPGDADDMLTYSSADGYVLTVERRR
jgi:hypothetical protein